jgi:hypothetical protein
MTLMEEIVEALRIHGHYKVSTVLLNKEDNRQVYVLLEKFEPNRETPTTYLPIVTYNIVFYATNSLTIEDEIVAIIQCVHDNVTAAHLNFDDVQINALNNDVEVKLVLRKYRVISFD